MEADVIDFINSNREIGKKWTLDQWRDQVLDVISQVYQKKDYHTMVIDQILCYNIKRLNKGRFIFKCNSNRDKNKLDKLLNLPKGTAQKTLEWHQKRHNHINASEANEVLSSSYKSILNKKVSPFTYRQITGLAAELGHRYEPISIQINELKTGKKIYEFESIEHSTYTFLAASPDGIDEDGIMKEIKNPSVREIIGIPKPEYWVQTQLQMECCDFNACDFIECSIKEYECIEYYRDDIDTKYKGCILEYWDEKKKCHRYYSNMNISINEINLWKSAKINEIKKQADIDEIYINEVYWKLEKYSCFRVFRDRQWFKSVLPKFQQFWQEVEKYRIIGIPENMMTKKKPIKEEITTITKHEPVKCLIDDDEDY